MSLWVPVLVACAGSYLVKLAGLSLPSSVLANPRVQRVTSLLPVAMLSALVCVQLVQPGPGTSAPYAVDWPVLVGVAAGAVALLLRRGFLVVFVVAVVVTALLRLLVPG
jgi:branched-subunit amino acid transport protein